MGVASHLGIKLADYDRSIRALIPHYSDLLEAAEAAVDAVAPVAPVVVDLGTGSGALARQILRVRPLARVIGVDEDAGMLAMARKRLSGSAFEPVAGNFERAPIPRCDLVSASFALHHIRTARRKAALYRRAHSALVKGGALVSADCALASDPTLQAAHRAAWLQHLQQKYSKRQAAAFLRAWAKEDVYFTLEQETAWLERAGFRVDVVLRLDSFATVIARK